MLHLDLDQGECDAATAVAQARRYLVGQSHDSAEAERACATLSSPLLGGAPEEWIVAAQHDLDGVRAQVERRLAFGDRVGSGRTAGNG